MEPGPVDGRRLPSGLAGSLVFATSFVTLMVEILAALLLAPYVGVTIETYTVIIGTVLAGIAAGAWLGGSLADRMSPRLFIGPVLFAAGVSCVLALPIVRWLGDGLASGDALSVLILTAVGFVVPAIALSVIPPAVVKLQLRDLAASGATVGRLSALSTAGAISGTFVTGLILIQHAAVSTLIVTVGIVVALAGAALSARAVRKAPGGAAAAMVVFGASLFAASAVDDACDDYTTYYCVAFEADSGRASGRVLMLDDQRHSYVDVDDPSHLEFWYTRRFADGIDAHLGDRRQPSDDIGLLYIGGGALTVPRYVHATRPDTHQTVLEIDGGLIDLVRDTAPFDRSIEVRVGDARKTIGELGAGSFDVVVGDAFGSRAVPWHLTTREFLAEVHSRLRPGGLYVMNVIDGRERAFVRAEVATLRAVFRNVAVVLGPRAERGQPGNSVLFASDGPLPIDELREALRARGDAGRVETEGPLFAPHRILTDDYAPVDQLIAR